MDKFYDFAREESKGSIHYVFQTDNGTIYSVYFNPSDFSDYLGELPFLSEVGYLFGFFPIKDVDGKKKHDIRILDTIYKIIDDFFNTYGPEKVLLYHCDSEDGKERIRNKLFNNWYRKKPDGIIFVKDELEVDIEKPDGTIKTEYLGFVINSASEDAIMYNPAHLDHPFLRS